MGEKLCDEMFCFAVCVYYRFSLKSDSLYTKNAIFSYKWDTLYIGKSVVFLHKVLRIVTNRSFEKVLSTRKYHGNLPFSNEWGVGVYYDLHSS